MAPPTAWAEPPHHPVNLSFLYPIATNRDPGISTNFRLNVLYARAGEVRGIDLGGLVARTDGDFRGLELALGHSWVGGELRGIAATGLVGVAGKDVHALQMSGIVNFDRAGFRGVQAAGILNTVDGPSAGAQFASGVNLCGGDAHWLQFAGVANLCGGSFSGLQLGNFNFASGGLHGVQAGLCNFAMEAEGVQAGLLNVAGDMHGTQIGVVNISKQIDGVPVGMVNVSQTDGETRWLFLGSTLAGVSVGVRTAVRGVYSMVTAGVVDFHDERSNTLLLDWHYGWAKQFNPRLRIGGDLGFVHIIPHPSDDPAVNDRLHFALQPRLIAERQVGERIDILGGVGASVIWNEYSEHATAETDPLVVLGLSVR